MVFEPLFFLKNKYFHHQIGDVPWIREKAYFYPDMNQSIVQQIKP